MNSNRTLYAIDLDTLIGGRSVDAATVSATAAAVESLRHPAHQVVIASSHRLVPDFGWVAPWARWTWRSGPHGPALALVDALACPRVPDRFAQVTLMSGDGVFTDVVVALNAAGVRTTVMCEERAVARRLRLAAHTFTALNGTEVARVAA